jgi:urease accessory protein UreE
MICQRIRGNIAERLEYSAVESIMPGWDLVDLHWKECGRVLKTRSRSGREIRVALPRGEVVRHGDVLFEDEEGNVAIHVEPCELIVVPFSTAAVAARLALELGNLHLPVEINDTELYFPPDSVAIEMAEATAGSWRREVRRFRPQSLIAMGGVALSRDFQVIHGLG